MQEEQSFVVLKTELEDRSFFRFDDIIAYVPARSAVEAHIEINKYYKDNEEDKSEGRHWVVNMNDIVDFTDSILKIRDGAEVTSTYVQN
ncbi:hypothetical protein [Salibacterium aidingense]|uniref:hypothetical protein n=1 Tax=Salibacterium aidingense TaxID=384933 RepID=UPI000425BFEF|nr:hypothetical protein [Salibacterium aidingense]